MKVNRSGFFIEKAWVLKRVGIALIAVVLIFFMLFFSLPQLRSPTLIAYSYSLFGLGVLLIFLNKALQIIQYSRIKDAPVRCLQCGWYGRGRDWYRMECCPECDSERVIQADAVDYV